MKGGLLRSLVCKFALLTLLVSTLTIRDFIAPVIVEDGMSKAYAMAFPGGGHRDGISAKKSPRKAQIAEGDSASAPDENAVDSGGEPLILGLTGLGLLGVAWLWRRLRARKLNKNNESDCAG